MNKRPWENWVPGVLSKQQAEILHQLGLITLEGNGLLDVGAASIDLTLANQGFMMKDGSMKPSKASTYMSVLADPDLAEPLSASPDGSYTLQKKHTYVFVLRERLEPNLAHASVYGQATAKSTIGRVDVLARLIVDGMDTYERFIPDGLKAASGKMYIEITPNTFDVQVQPGIAITQLRLFYGDPRYSRIEGHEICRTVLGTGAKDHMLTLELASDQKGGIAVSAFCAKTTSSPICLWKKGATDPCSCWRFVPCHGKNRLQIKSENFYILRSKEKLCVPKGVAIYCKASDETIGEMRIHYAGFVHPGFGAGRTDQERGTSLIFEVRGHQVDAHLTDGEKMANLEFYRMSEDATEDNKDYNDQKLQLSKIFQKWPDKLTMDEDGNVEPS